MLSITAFLYSIPLKNPPGTFQSLQLGLSFSVSLPLSPSLSLSLQLFFLQLGLRHCGVFGLDTTEIKSNDQNAKEGCVA